LSRRPTSSASAAARSRLPVEAQRGTDPVRQEDVLDDGQVLEQPELLEHHADALDAQPAPSRVVERRDLGPAHDDPAGAGPSDAGDQVEQRRLPGAARSDDRDDAARRDGERRGPEPEPARRVTEVEAAQLDHGR
jgi:hypothetical protein